MLGSPEETAYDLRFRLLNIPVRVHPLFWLVMLLLSSQPENLRGAVLFAACAFLSVLVHEMGHGLASRAVGNEPEGIVLYAMGGFCQMRVRHQGIGQRLFVLIMGPGAGFLLLGVVLAVIQRTRGIAPVDAMAMIGVGPGNPIDGLLRLGYFQNASAGVAIHSLLYINFWWGVLNLMPIWPLDGGRIAEVGLKAVNPREGTRWTHVLALLTAGGLAVWSAANEQYTRAFFFGYFAYTNYQMLQSLHGSDPYADEGDWWRR